MRRSETSLKGMGEEVIKVRADELRDLAELPDEVQIVRMLPPPQSNWEGWHIPERNLSAGNYVLEEEQWAYVLVRSRYAIRRPPRQPLSYTMLDEFLTRWNDLWSKKK